MSPAVPTGHPSLWGRQRAGRHVARSTVGLIMTGVLVLSVVTSPLAAEPVVEEPSAETTAAIDAMVLTKAGYREFVRRVNHSHLSYAQGWTDFNPRRVDIPQGPSRAFVWHFTVDYFNTTGPAAAPQGRPAPRQLVRFMARRTGVCCGVNWFVDRNGRTHRLAPLHAKLRHNPPYDSVVTGVEVEAADQKSVTTKQYEALAYLTMRVLHRQGLLRTEPLRKTVRGHGEMRDAYLERNPRARWGERDDFDQPVSKLLRTRINRFLAAHPNFL